MAGEKTITMTKVRKAAVIFIFITVLIDVIGFGIIIPVLPELLAEMMDIGINDASMYGGALLFAFAIPQFLFSPFFGNLSDRFGRRPVILLSLLGFTIDYLILALAPSYYWLVFGRIIAGFFGASYTTASAYIADISTDENRSQNFGMLGAAFGLGFIIGPLLGGVLGTYGLRLPFYVAAALTFLNFLYGYFILPESLEEQNRREFEWKKANPLSTLIKLSKYKQIGVLFLAYFLLYLGSHAVQSNWTFFTMYRFEWDSFTVGVSLAVVGILVGVVQAVLAQKAADKYGLNRSIIWGFGLYTIGMFLFAFASASWMMFVFLIPYCLGGIASPNIQALMVSQVPVNQQGELQGGLTSIGSITTIIGPVMMTGIFYYFTSNDAPIHFPGSAFFLGGIFMLISYVIVYLFLRDKKE